MKQVIQRCVQMLSRLLVLGLTALTTLSLSACEDEVEPRSFVIRDSAGIEILESRLPLWDSDAAWWIDAEPEVVIGEREGDPRYLLGDVRGARRLDDGRIVIADLIGQRLRVYSQQGEHLYDIGGQGDGPGEFSFLNYFEVTGDTLVVYNYFPPAVSQFSVDGTFLETNRIQVTGHAAAKSVIPFGYLLDSGHGLGTTSPDDALDFDNGLNRLPRPLWRFRLDGSEFTELTQYDGTEVVIERSETRTQYTSYPFAKSPAVATSGNAIYMARSEDYAVYVYDHDYQLHRIVRRRFTPRSTTADDLARWIDAQIAYFGPGPEEEPEFRRVSGELAYAPTMPALKSMTIDPLGNLWVEDWPGSMFEAGNFSVFDSHGRWLGAVELPIGRAPAPGPFDPWLEVGEDYVLGVWKGALDVDQVRL